MNIPSYIIQMKGMYNEIFNFVCNQNNSEMQFKKLVQLFIDSKISENTSALREIIHIINTISNNHHRTATFYSKIDQIIEYLKDDILKSFSNFDIYSIVKNNKRLLLCFIEKNIITVNKIIATNFFQQKTNNYFYTEIQKAFNSKIDPTKDPKYQEYEQNRRNGENESKICQIIRNDSLDEFISLYQNNDISFQNSIFETNELFLDTLYEFSLINYATYFGSINIVKYLLSQNVHLPGDLWLFAVHSDNIENLKILIEKNIGLEYDSLDFTNFPCDDCDDIYEVMIKAAINCHHNEMAKYIKSNFIKDKNIDNLIYFTALQSYNYEFIPDDFSNLDHEKLFSTFCTNDYVFYSSCFLNEINAEKCLISLCESINSENVEIVKLLVSKQGIDINSYYINDEEKIFIF